jgi:hypothetical protein
MAVSPCCYGLQTSLIVTPAAVLFHKFFDMLHQRTETPGWREFPFMAMRKDAHAARLLPGGKWSSNLDRRWASNMTPQKRWKELSTAALFKS